MTDEGSRAILRGHCPNCGADRNAEVLAEDTLEKEESGIWFRSTHSILRCLGCDTRYIRRVELCSEDWDHDFDPDTGETSMMLNERVTYWPSIPTTRATRRRPDWLWCDPLEELGLSFGVASEYPELASLLGEVYKALDNKLLILATIGMRTVFDCASQKLGADPNQSFAEKLKELTAGNKIGGEEKEILSVLADAGRSYGQKLVTA